MSANVKNYFEQPAGDGTDNVLVLGGTVTKVAGSVENISGTVNVLTGGVVDFETGSALNAKSGSTVTMDSGSVGNISGTVNVLTGGVLDMETGSALNLKAGSTTTVTGALNSPAGVSMKSLYISVDMTDISSAGSVWVSPGRACTFKRLVSIINGAITVGDAVITTQIAGVAVTNGSLTIANAGSAAGDVDTATPTALNVLTSAQGLEIVSDGGSTDTCRATFVAEFELA